MIALDDPILYLIAAMAWTWFVLVWGHPATKNKGEW